MLKIQNIKQRRVSMNDNFAPYLTIGDENRICLECTKEKCRGDCKHFREEIKKLKTNKRRNKS